MEYVVYRSGVDKQERTCTQYESVGDEVSCWLEVARTCVKGAVIGPNKCKQPPTMRPAECEIPEISGSCVTVATSECGPVSLVVPAAILKSKQDECHAHSSRAY